MRPHEEDPDFTWEDNQAYADIICNGLDPVDLQFLEDFATGVWGDDDEVE